jgi:membrane-associated phospholipid phosphatase
VLVDALKITVRRDRPDNSQGSWNFSFPSGHSAQTFAGATVLERHLGWKKAVLAYVVAAYVASSRLHDNVHYVSDVAFGATIGTIAGRTVTRHGQNSWTFIPVSMPGGGGALLASRRF